MSRRGVQFAGVAVLALVAGLWLGAWGAHAHRWRAWHSQERQARLLQVFTRRLHLTPPQQAQVRAVLDAGHGRMQSLHEQTRAQFQALRAETAAQIRAVLTPEQARTFDTMEAERDARWRRGGGRHRMKTQGGEVAAGSSRTQEEGR